MILSNRCVIELDGSVAPEEQQRWAKREPENTHEVSFLLWWPPLRFGEDGSESSDWQLLWCYCFDGARSHGWDFFLFSLSASIFSCLSFLFRVTPMVPLFVMSVLRVSLLVLLWNSHNTVINIPAQLKMVEISFFFNLKTQKAVPEIAGLSAGEILFEAGRQEI